MCRVQELRPYLRGQCHTNILKFHFITIKVYRFTHLCSECTFVMHGRILEYFGINVYHIKTMCRVHLSRPYLKGQGQTTILNFTISKLEFIVTHIRVLTVTLSYIEGLQNN